MEKAEAFWDNSAGNYDRTEERFESIHRTSRKSARKHLRKKDVVLDYGCGTGTTACELSTEVARMQAIDISSKMIELAKAKARDANIRNVNFAQGDIFDKDYADESFDAILAFNMLHTVPDAHSVVRRIHKLLKPGGLIITVTPCLRDKLSFVIAAQIKIVQFLCAIGVIPVPIRRLKSADLDGLVLGEDFQIVDSENLFAGASSYFLVAEKVTQNSDEA